MKKSTKRVILSTISIILLTIGLFVYSNQSTSIPILLYHHVNDTDHESISVTPEMFEKQMKYLYENNYKTLFLDEMDEIIKKGDRLPSKSVVITFDDGYLDNWIYAYPILKKYKIKATIFVITSYIDNEKKYRPNLEDIWNGIYKKQSLEISPAHNEINLQSIINIENAKKYFLSWDEIRQMVDSGLIEIESHTHTHKSYFISNKIVDFNRDDHWVTASNTNGDIRLGIPIYERASTIVARKFFDDKILRNFLADYVNNNGGENFFKKNSKEYKKILMDEVEKYRKSNKLNESFESQIKQMSRIKEELLLSRKLIEEHIGRKCEFIAWPWGEYDENCINMAKELGYAGAFTTQKGSNKIRTDNWRYKRIKVWPRGNWWFGIRLYAYSNAPLTNFFSLFTK